VFHVDGDVSSAKLHQTAGLGVEDECSIQHSDGRSNASGTEPDAPSLVRIIRQQIRA
jgi:hypothetical protein